MLPIFKKVFIEGKESRDMDIPEEALEVEVKENTKLSICSCGHSKKLPYCDNTHREVNEKEGTSYASVKIWPNEDVKIKVFSKNWTK